MPITFHSQPAIIVYLTCGDPDLETTREIALAAIAAGAEAIELGVPFSDPVADGPVIQRASERALRQGTRLADILEVAREIKLQSQAGLILFSYWNPVLRFGLEKFCQHAKAVGLDGALITDLPVEEAGDYLKAMRRHELETIFLAAPTSTDARLKRIAEASTGFIYAVSRTGVTGTRNELAADARELTARLRRFTEKPVALGFGISTPEQLREAGTLAEAVVVGSAVVEIVERAASSGRAPEAVAEFVKELAAVSRQPSASTAL